jgi:dihydroneopterin aldolase
MVFEILTNLVETHKTELAHSLAKEILAHHLSSYQHASEATLAVQLEATLAGIILYLRSSDPTEYRNFIKNLL